MREQFKACAACRYARWFVRRDVVRDKVNGRCTTLRARVGTIGSNVGPKRTGFKVILKDP